MSNTMRKLINFPVGARTTATALTDQDMPNLAQVQSLIAGNNAVKEAVAIEADVDFDISAGGLTTLDGYSVQDGDRVLLHAQTDAAENGVYIASAGAWSRAADMDESSELQPYTKVTVLYGGHAGRTYQLLNTIAPTVDTDSQNWAIVSQFSGAASDTTLTETNFSNFSGANVQAAFDSVDDAFDSATVDTDSVRQRLSTLLGSTGDNLGAFTGGIIPNGTDLLTAFQSLVDATNAAAGKYAEGRYQSGITTLNTGAAVPFDHNLGEIYPAMVEVYDAVSTEKITHTVTISTVSANRIAVQNDDAASVGVVVVVRA